MTLTTVTKTMTMPVNMQKKPKLTYLSMLSFIPEVRARRSQADRAATTGACANITVSCCPEMAAP